MVGMSLGSVNSVSVSGKGENSGGTSVFVSPAVPAILSLAPETRQVPGSSHGYG
jgi:hypothetical protein